VIQIYSPLVSNNISPPVMLITMCKQNKSEMLVPVFVGSQSCSEIEAAPAAPRSAKQYLFQKLYIYIYLSVRIG
jgi:hypothetical protein